MQGLSFPTAKTILPNSRVFALPRLGARARLTLQALAVLGIFTGLFASVQYATPGLADHDGYYHMRLARLMGEQGLTPDFVWLPLSILNAEAYYDHHLLYHAYLSLFAGSADPADLIAGAKLASVLMPSLAGLAAWWLLRGQGVRWAALWALGLMAVSEAFLYRLSMPRAQAASLLVLILSLHGLLTRRYWALLPLGFVYVWLYNAFPLLLVVAGVYAAATWATERRLAWQPLAYAAAGLALGLVINPYFPRNLVFIFQHLSPKLGGSSTPVGNEWYPYQTWTLVENSGAALAAFVLGALAMAWRGQRPNRATLATFGLSVVFGLMLFKSRRFVEYFPAFALLFLALAAAPLVSGWAEAARRRLGRLAAAAAPLALAALLALPLARTLDDARAAMQRSLPPTRYAAASAWLQANSAPGSLIFQTDWDDFPRLFFYNPQNLYTAGLDPTYLELYDPALYAEWVEITQGEVTPPSPAIRAGFGAEYAITDLKHGDFLRAAADDPGMVEVYRDGEAVIFQLVD
jgi:hypothetical protein